MAELNGHTARAQLWVSIAATAFIVLSAFTTLAFTAVAAKNKADALEARMVLVEETSRLNRAQVAVIDAKLVEIETQFRASDQVRNLMHANDLRMTSLLWQKAYPGTHFPTDNSYYPTIAQDQRQ